MVCGKIYEWTNKQTRNIPLPEIAKELLRCKSDKIFRFFYTGERNDFNIIIGCDTKEDAVKLVVKNLNIELEEAKENIDLWPLGWEVHSPFDWSHIEPDRVSLLRMTKDIMKYQTDKIYRIQKENSDEFEVVVGAKTMEEAVEAATEFWYAMHEEEILDYTGNEADAYDIVCEMRNWIYSRTKLWTINDI